MFSTLKKCETGYGSGSWAQKRTGSSGDCFSDILFIMIFKWKIATVITMFFHVHNVLSCTQCTFDSCTKCSSYVHNVLLCTQCSFMYTMHFHVHNALSCTQCFSYVHNGSFMYTMFFYVHNVTSCSSQCTHVYNVLLFT